MELDEIREAARAYYREYGVAPTPHTKRPTPGTGQTRTYWLTVSRQLARRGISFEEVVKSAGLQPRAGEIPDEKIEKACRAYFQKHRARPDRASGKAADYFEGDITWSAIDARLRLQGSSLKVVCDRLNIPTRRQQKLRERDERLLRLMTGPTIPAGDDGG